MGLDNFFCRSKIHLNLPSSKTLTNVYFLYLTVLVCCHSVKCFYLNQIAVHIEGGSHIADRIARKHGFKNWGQIGDLKDHYLFFHPHIAKRSTNPSHVHHRLLSQENEIRWFEQQYARSRKKRDNFNFNDRLYRSQWYLNGGGHKGNRGNYDMSVKGAWQMGYTGKNIVVTILDDGIERTHDDLKENYDPYASYDVNGHDHDPMPRYDPTNENRHGTRCAGEVAAKADNSKCIVGAAYNAKIGGVRMLDGDVSDAVEAASLSFNKTHIDIYSASWGPDDDGRVVDGPGPLAKKAFTDGIEQGRGGKGCIFVWASGNGGSAFDSCNCDGYTNSIYTLSISSTSEHGRKPWYLEECSSTLATTYSSGAYNEKQIISTDLHNQCTSSHTGTSASAPLAAGLVALLLEANPSLTWRDVQYITLLTSNPEPMEDGQWTVNGKNRKVSLRYGYGLMNATAMVDYGLRWRNVPPKHICSVMSSVSNVNLDGSPFTSEVHTDGCKGTANEVNYLEHVQAKLSLQYYRRGNLVIHLVSPSGTKSTLLPKRPSDMSQGGFNNWAFLSVHFWEENPTGTWRLEIEDQHSASSWPRPPAGSKGKIVSWSLILHGTKDNPVNLKDSAEKPEIKTTTKTTPRVQGTTSPPKCHSECLDTCRGPRPQDCISCKHIRMGEEGDCVTECPEGHRLYKNKCLPCDTTCMNCTSLYGIKSHCQVCKDGFFMLEGEGRCSVECPEGYFLENRGHRICKKCNNLCESCSEDENKCTSCPKTLTLLSNKCYVPKSICSKGYYKYMGSCHKCAAGCLLCHAADKCVQCDPASFMHNGQCRRDCPGGYLPYVVKMDQSTSHQECRICQNGNCNNCVGDFVKRGGTCQQQKSCMREQYFDFINMECKDCHYRCKSCFGSGSHECLACEEPLAYHSYLQTCVPCCKPGEKEGSCCHCLPQKGVCMINGRGLNKFSGMIFVVLIVLISMLLLLVVSVIIFMVVKKSALCQKGGKGKEKGIQYSRLTQEDL